MKISTLTIEGEIYSLEEGVNIIDLLYGVFKFPEYSKTEFRRLIKQNAVSINMEKIGSHEHKIYGSDFLHDKYLLLQVGKKLFMFKLSKNETNT